MGRDIGRAGEAVIEGWCALSGITANKSHTDRHGWDLLFEMGPFSDIGSAHGLHESNIECKVQVKTTDTQKKTVSVELSNLRAMATTTLPSFYILLELAGGDTPKSVHLLHIDNEHCEKILKRVRIETTKPEHPKLHKKTMSIDFAKGVELKPLNGDSLREAILKFVTPSQSSYVVQKQRFLNSVGFEKNSYEVSFTIDATNTKLFVDMLLGGNAAVQAYGIQASVKRFGVKEPMPDVQSASAVLRVSDILPDGRATIQFRNRSSGGKAEFELDVFRGGVAKCIPAKYRTVRLRAERFTIDISVPHNTMTIQFHDLETVPCDLAELLRHYKFLKLISDPSAVDIAISIDNSRLCGSMKGEGFIGNFDHSVKILEAATLIKNHFEYFGPLPVIPSTFATIGKTTINYAKFITDHLSKVEITFEADLSDPETMTDIIVAMPAILGEVLFVEVWVLTGPASHREINYTLRPTSKRSIYKTYFNKTALGTGEVEQEIQRVVENYQSDFFVLDSTDLYIAPLVEQAKIAIAP